MPKPEPVEIQALEQAGTLLKFAAENKQLTDNIASTVALSWEAKENDTWTPDTSSKFWAAYSSLCTSIKPVTIDTISSNAATVGRPGWQFWRSTAATSLSKRSGYRYLLLLTIFLILAIILQFAVSYADSLRLQIDKMKDAIEESHKLIVAEMSKINVGDESKKFANASLTPDQISTINKVTPDFRDVWRKEDQVATKVKQFSILTTLQPFQWNDAGFEPIDSMKTYQKELTTYYQNMRDFTAAEDQGALVINVINAAVLPLLLGVMGASAYITRLISDQIKETTFSSTSPIRHRVRLTLGALAGVIVGFGWIGSPVSASPLALAFAAGYAVEPVFATVDGIAEKFRRP
jgi:hypothetical protein